MNFKICSHFSDMHFLELRKNSVAKAISTYLVFISRVDH